MPKVPKLRVANQDERRRGSRAEREQQRTGIIQDERGQDQPQTKEDAQKNSGHPDGDDVLKRTPL
jgi:hypothetical protein